MPQTASELKRTVINSYFQKNRPAFYSWLLELITEINFFVNYEKRKSSSIDSEETTSYQMLVKQLESHIKDWEQMVEGNLNQSESERYDESSSSIFSTKKTRFTVTMSIFTQCAISNEFNNKVMSTLSENGNKALLARKATLFYTIPNKIRVQLFGEEQSSYTKCINNYLSNKKNQPQAFRLTEILVHQIKKQISDQYYRLDTSTRNTAQKLITQLQSHLKEWCIDVEQNFNQETNTYNSKQKIDDALTRKCFESVTSLKNDLISETGLCALIKTYINKLTQICFAYSFFDTNNVPFGKDKLIIESIDTLQANMHI